MARETLDAVKQMEINAAMIESQASTKYDEIILGARKKSKEIIALKEKEALDIAKIELDNAKVLGDKIIQDAVNKGNIEKDKLLARTEENRQAAIDLIISQIV